MMKSFGLVSLVLAASLALSGCQEKDAGNAAAASPAAPTSAAPSTAAAPTPAGTKQAGSPTGGACEGFAGQTCTNKADFCKKPVGQCGVADAQGTCTTRPEICTKEYVPVCGCDGKTYGNACEAAAAGVSVQSAGACAKPKA